jgi:hypothetical protein
MKKILFFIIGHKIILLDIHLKVGRKNVMIKLQGLDLMVNKLFLN